MTSDCKTNIGLIGSGSMRMKNKKLLQLWKKGDYKTMKVNCQSIVYFTYEDYPNGYGFFEWVNARHNKRERDDANGLCKWLCFIYIFLRICFENKLFFTRLLLYAKLVHIYFGKNLVKFCFLF